MKLKFKKLHNNGSIPTYAHPGDAAFDIYSSENILLKKGDIKIVKTGISSEFPAGYFVSFRDRSGLSSKTGLHIMGGVIDAGYRGEWGVIMVNLGKKKYKIAKGERVAQGIVHKLPKVEIIKVTKTSKSERGAKGFGSTGKR